MRIVQWKEVDSEYISIDCACSITEKSRIFVMLLPLIAKGVTPKYFMFAVYENQRRNN
jgi:hypothetical protein